MNLAPAQSKRFFTIFRSLLAFVNEQRQIVPDKVGKNLNDPLSTDVVQPIREVLWAEDALRESFIQQNPDRLSKADLAIVRSWQYRRSGRFTILRQLKKHAIVIGSGENEVYAMLGLLSPLEDLVPFLPCFVELVLLPFEQQITYDGLVLPYTIYLGPGIRSDYEDIYKDAKERGAIITSLMPTRPLTVKEKLSVAKSSNSKVLEEFRKHLYKTGLSPKVVEREMATALEFAEAQLAARPEPLSLRDLTSNQVGAYFTDIQGAALIKQVRLGLKRLVKFLRDTGRMDYDEAQNILDELK